jgi:hypothetical protein
MNTLMRVVFWRCTAQNLAGRLCHFVNLSVCDIAYQQNIVEVLENPMTSSGIEPATFRLVA